VSDLYWYEYQKGRGICTGKCVIVEWGDSLVTIKPQFSKQITRRKENITLTKATEEE